MRVGIAGPADPRMFASFIPKCAEFRPGPKAPFLASLAGELVRIGHEVTVICHSPHVDEVGRHHGEALDLVVTPQRPRAKMRMLNLFGTEIGLLSDEIRRSRLDVVHGHWTYEYGSAAIRSGVPHLVTVHDWAPEVLRHQPGPYRLSRAFLQRRVLRQATALSANSPYIAERIESGFGRKVPVVPNGVAFPDTLNRSYARNSPRRIGALNVGFGSRKNVQTLLRGFARIRRTADLSLVLAGPEYSSDGEAARWARRAGLADGVIFFGEIAPNLVDDFMAGLDLFVHPSLEESFGMVLIEALRNGTPVIGGRASGAVPWVLGEGRSGVLADVTTPEGIAEAIHGWLQLPDSDVQLKVQEAFDDAASRFSLSTVARAFEGLYQESIRVTRGRL